MKNILIILSAFVLLTSCSSKKNQASNYFSTQEQDTLLTNIITYIYSPAPGANNNTKFETKYRSFYQKALPFFKIQEYYQTEDGWNYVFIIRPVSSSPIFRRGVLAKFKLKEGSLKPESFEEVINTPHLREEIVVERGGFLFKELIKKGNVDEYLSMKQYIEWPDDHLKYNKATHEWVTVKPY